MQYLVTRVNVNMYPRLFGIWNREPRDEFTLMARDASTENHV